jgi:hypothetical protein
MYFNIGTALVDAAGKKNEKQIDTNHIQGGIGHGYHKPAGHPWSLQVGVLRLVRRRLGHLRVFQLLKRLAAGWISVQPRPVSQVVCTLLLPGLLPTSAPPPELSTPLLPWAVWMAHMPLFPPSSSRVPQAATSVPHFPKCFACLVLQTWSAHTRTPFLVFIIP